MPLVVGPFKRKFSLDILGRTVELATKKCMIDANVVMICGNPLVAKQRSPYQKSFESSTENRLHVRGGDNDAAFFHQLTLLDSKQGCSSIRPLLLS